MVECASAARSRVRRTVEELAAQTALSNPCGRTRSDGFFIWLDLGLGVSGRQRGNARPSQPRCESVLFERPRLPSELRTFGGGFSFALPRRGGLHAQGTRPRGIRSLVVGIPARYSSRYREPLACSWRGHRKRRSEACAHR